MPPRDRSTRASVPCHNGRNRRTDAGLFDVYSAHSLSLPSNQSINQSINQYIYNAPWYRGACYSADYAEAKRNVLSRVLNVITDVAVRQFRGREFQSLGAATEKRRAAVSKLCGGTDRSSFPSPPLTNSPL